MTIEKLRERPPLGNASVSDLDEELGRTKLWFEIEQLYIRKEQLLIRAEQKKDKLNVSWDRRKYRKPLMIGLSVVSVLWLLFTGYIICCLAFGHRGVFPQCQISDIVATAFITSSLATVLGLWAIGLGYFFAHERTGSNEASSKK